MRRRLKALDADLLDLKGEEQTAVSAQLSGVRAGASPEAYAAVFADIALRRKDLEEKRVALSGPPRRPKGKPADGDVMAGMLKAALAVLSDPNVPGSEKRSALSPIVDRVVCQKGGADVVFAPGLFDGAWGEGDGLWDRDGARQTCQTTCMGMRTQR